jgi:drug/metabolite transporter (DMT)-like permease
MVSVTFFSINDTIIKLFSGDYALHQIVLFRSAIGLFFVMVLFAPFSGGFGIVRTKRLGMHLIRGLLVVMANMTFFLGLAAMPLADAVAIFFISPLVITTFSVIFLKEQVGLRRWLAIAVGFIGVLIIVQPGTSAFQYTSLLPMIAAVSYAGIHTMTRQIGGTESAATMAFYIQVAFSVVCILIGLAVGDGKFADQSNASLAFLFREWRWPDLSDYTLLVLLGFGVAVGGFFISQAYRVAEAGFVAPFEYVAMPLSILWGYLFFDEIPKAITFLGVSLILSSGLYTIMRERKVGVSGQSPKTRR